MSQDEQVDIVDENGNFIETVSKKYAHEKGLLHACVIGQVINSKGEYLLIKHPAHKQDPGQYICPMGGHITSGESEADSVRRELEEEIGVKNYTSEYMGRGILNREVLGRKENHIFILYKIFSDDIPTTSDEVDDFQYFTENELRHKIKTNPNMFGFAYHFVVKQFFPNLIS